MTVRMMLLLCLGLAACSDYNFKGTEAPSEPGEAVDTAVPEVVEEPTGAPFAVVTPSSVDLGIVCGVGTADVTIENQGDADFSVTHIDTNSPNWSAVHDILPAVLAPGASLVVTVSGSPVDTTMVIETTDPAHSTLQVPLTATADAPPSLAITNPATDTTIDVGASASFEAQVSDDAGPADAVSIAWVSDVDGLLSTASPDGTGVARFVWDGNVRSAGTHVVTVTATDACENAIEAEVVVCQNEGYLAENLDLATWNFEGDATWDAANRWVELTRPLNTQSGTAFQTAATVDSANVQIEFDFYASGGSGADGFSVTALDSTRMTSFVGGSGGGIGYYGLPGWSIEVDTWYNSEHNDPTVEDHVSVHFDGDVDTPTAWAALPEMEDGSWHRMRVDVLGTWITVAIDGATYIDQDVAQLTSFPAYVGFTAATGGATNYHLIDALEVEEFICD